MPINEELSDLYLSKAKDIISLVESGDTEQADKVVEELSAKRDTGLFQELGKLTREFHDALNGFQADARITEITGTDIPDARERLQHVITMTDKSAHRTMTVIEDVLPKCELLEEQGSNIMETWRRFVQRDLEPQEFRDLCKEIEDFLERQVQGNIDVRKGMTEIMMAQDFQDITGQIISRVINLVTDLENSLVDIIREGGEVMKEKPSGKSVQGRHADDAHEGLSGPQVPGIEDVTSVSGQDEVDDLLSSLGF